MRAREDIESFFIRMNVDVEKIDDDMWVIRSEGTAGDVVVHYSPPVLLLRMRVMRLPAERDDGRMGSFYRRLLELNATDIVHGSYGIEESDVILSDTLELEDLGFSELRSSYESMVMAAATQTAGLAGLVPAAQGG